LIRSAWEAFREKTKISADGAKIHILFWSWVLVVCFVFFLYETENTSSADEFKEYSRVKYPYLEQPTSLSYIS